MINKRIVSFMTFSAFVGMAMFNISVASAKSTTKIVYDRTINKPANSRNVNLTTRNAIYSKPGILKSAKVVATKATTKRLQHSNKDNDNFRAYRIIKTNRGTYYYKIVSFDSHYRGWIYGGKSRTGYYGGVKPFTTVKNTSIKSPLTPDGDTNYHIPSSLISETTNTFFFQAPKYTQYKVGRKISANHKVISATSKYKDTPFTLVRSIQTTRSGDLWYQIASNDQDINGAWIPGNQISNSDVVTSSTNSGTNESSTSTSSSTTTNTSIMNSALQIANLAGRTDYFNGNSLNANYSNNLNLQAAYTQGYNAAASDAQKAKSDAIADVKNGMALNKSYSGDLGIQRVYESMYNNCETARNQGINDCTDGKLSNANYSLDGDLQAAYQAGYNSIAATKDIYQLGISFTIDGVDQSGAFWNALNKTQQDALVSAAAADKLPQSATEVTSADVQKVLEDAKISTIIFNGKTIKFSNADAVSITPSTATVQVPVIAHYISQ